MDRKKKTRDPAPKREDSPTTRSEALREALKARRPPEPPREFSTLVEGSEPVWRHLECADPRNCAEHGGGLVPDQLVWPEHATMALLAALAAGMPAESQAVRAGRANSSRDVVDDESEGEPRAAASEQSDGRSGEDQE